MLPDGQTPVDVSPDRVTTDQLGLLRPRATALNKDPNRAFGIVIADASRQKCAAIAGESDRITLFGSA